MIATEQSRPNGITARLTHFIGAPEPQGLKVNRANSLAVRKAIEEARALRKTRLERTIAKSFAGTEPPTNHEPILTLDEAIAARDTRPLGPKNWPWPLIPSFPLLTHFIPAIEANAQLKQDLARFVNGNYTQEATSPQVGLPPEYISFYTDFLALQAKLQPKLETLWEKLRKSRHLLQSSSHADIHLFLEPLWNEYKRLGRYIHGKNTLLRTIAQKVGNAMIQIDRPDGAIEIVPAQSAFEENAASSDAHDIYTTPQFSPNDPHVLRLVHELRTLPKAMGWTDMRLGIVQDAQGAIAITRFSWADKYIRARMTADTAYDAYRTCIAENNPQAAFALLQILRSGTQSGMVLEGITKILASSSDQEIQPYLPTIVTSAQQKLEFGREKANQVIAMGKTYIANLLRRIGQSLTRQPAPSQMEEALAE